VTDSAGKVVTSARISIANVETGVSREVTTNDEGFYSAPNLLPGTYNVNFITPGFKTEAHAGIMLTVAASITLDQKLRVGSITETVSVQSEIPAVQTFSSNWL
jgi:hypothetical protein